MLDHRLWLKEAAIEMSIEKRCTFHVRQIIRLKIILLESSKAQNNQAVHHMDSENNRPAKQIKFIQIYYKW